MPFKQVFTPVALVPPVFYLHMPVFLKEFEKLNAMADYCIMKMTAIQFTSVVHKCIWVKQQGSIH